MGSNIPSRRVEVHVKLGKLQQKRYEEADTYMEKVKLISSGKT